MLQDVRRVAVINGDVSWVSIAEVRSVLWHREWNTIGELKLQEIDEKGLGMFQDVRGSPSSMGMCRGYR